MKVETDLPSPSKKGISLAYIMCIAEDITKNIKGIRPITTDDVFIKLVNGDDGQKCISISINTKSVTRRIPK